MKPGDDSPHNSTKREPRYFFHVLVYAYYDYSVCPPPCAPIPRVFERAHARVNRGQIPIRAWTDWGALYGYLPIYGRNTRFIMSRVMESSKINFIGQCRWICIIRLSKWRSRKKYLRSHSILPLLPSYASWQNWALKSN